MDFDPPDPDPAKAYDAADKAGLGDWMSKHKKAGLYMELILWNKSMSFKKGYSPWVWRVRAWGPDVPLDFDLYLDAKNMKLLGGKSLPKSQDPGKKDKPQQQTPDDQGKADKSKQPTPDDQGKADKAQQPTPDDQGKADKPQQPTPSGDGKTGDPQKPEDVKGKPQDNK